MEAKHTATPQTFQIQVERRVKQTATLLINADTEFEAQEKAAEAVAHGGGVPWINGDVCNAHDDLVKIVQALVHKTNFQGMVWPAGLPDEEFCRAVLRKAGV